MVTKNKIIRDPVARATRISNLFEYAEPKSLWRRKIIGSTLKMIDQDHLTGVYLRIKITNTLLDQGFITVDFTRDQPVMITDKAKEYLKSQL